MNGRDNLKLKVRREINVDALCTHLIRYTPDGRVLVHPEVKDEDWVEIHPNAMLPNFVLMSGLYQPRVILESWEGMTVIE